MTWAKGQSGNPGGRPKSHGELRALALSHAPEMLEILLKIARESKDEKARVSAADKVLDRGLGKATQMLANDPDAGPLIVNIVKFRNEGGGDAGNHPAQ